MILQKEFYFIRHGQTDHNISLANSKGDHPKDIPLNETGRSQAKLIEPTISALPIKTVCSSPLRRAQETKEIITSRLQVDHHEIHDLGECSAQIWKEMSQLGMYSSLPKEGLARQFMDRVRNGINQALSLPGPSLIVAHGGVHWALCCLMGIDEHEWAISNCIPVHFLIGQNEKWIAKKLG
ncbi:MAG: histidine phosphatase family protein [Anaerolineae bacterium]